VEHQKPEFTLPAAELIAAIYGRVSLAVEPIRGRSARRVRKALARKDADLIWTDTVKKQAEDRKAAKARREAQRPLQKTEPETFIIKDPTEL
jgi:hypothetical protein